MPTKPSTVDALKKKGIQLVNSGQLDAAMEIYSNIHSIDKNDTDALIALGILNGMNGNYSSAEQYLGTAANLNPRLSAAHFNLGIAQKSQQKLDAAVSSYKRAIACEPDNPAYHNNLGTVFLEMHLPEQAIDCFSNALRLMPGSADYIYNLGKALKARGLRLKALDAFDRAVALRPAFSAALKEKGSVHLSLGNVTDARHCYQESLSIDPGDLGAVAGLANAYSNERRYQEAFALLQPYLVSNIDNSDIAIAFSAIAIPLHREHEAIQLLEKQLQSSRTDIDSRAQIYFRLGSFYDRTGDYDVAFDYFRRANELRGTDASGVHFKTVVDDIIRRFGTDTLQVVAPSGCASDLPVFIVGMPRSGTTLVEQILASHPSVHGAGELDTLPALLDEIPDLTGDIRSVSGNVLERAAATYIEHILSLAPQAARITDKMPANFQNIGYIHLLFPRARIIHCRRNPMDTCLSCYFQDFAGHLRYANDLASLGDYYVQYHRLMEHWSQVPGMRILHVDYEKLVSNFEEECRKLIDFCGLEWDPACLDFYKMDRIVVTASANQVTQPLYTGSVNRWLCYKDHLGVLARALGTLAPGALTPTDDAKSSK